MIASVIMFWKKVLILIFFLITAQRTLMMSSSHSGSGSRSHSSARSRGPTRRRSPRSRSSSGSEGECFQCVSPSDTTQYAEEVSSEVDDKKLDDYKVDVFIPTIKVQEIRPPEEALQNDFQVCQGQVAEHAGDAFANTRRDIVLHAIVKKLNTSNRIGGSFLPTYLKCQHVITC